MFKDFFEIYRKMIYVLADEPENCPEWVLYHHYMVSLVQLWDYVDRHGSSEFCYSKYYLEPEMNHLAKIWALSCPANLPSNCCDKLDCTSPKLMDGVKIQTIEDLVIYMLDIRLTTPLTTYSISDTGQSGSWYNSDKSGVLSQLQWLNFLKVSSENRESYNLHCAVVTLGRVLAEHRQMRLLQDDGINLLLHNPYVEKTVDKVEDELYFFNITNDILENI
ncbi:TPA: hypothetical protein ACH6AG_000128 [Campylobacter jejuni]